MNGLTWLRAIAAVVVIFSHVIRAAESNYIGFDSITVPTLFRSLDLGTFGVLLFFTLSGTTLYISSVAKTTSNIDFLIRRFFRIWPAFAFALFIYISFRFVFNIFYTNLSDNWIEGQFTDSYSVLIIFQYLSLTSNFYAPAGLFNNAFWSLPVEFQYYLCFPILMVLTRLFGIYGPLGFGLFLYSIYKFQLINVVDTKVFMLGFSFCFGVAIGHLHHNRKKLFKIPASGLFLFSIFVIASLITTFPFSLPDLPVISGIWNCYMILAALAVYLVLFNEPKLPNWIMPSLLRLGDISYSLYLLHNIVIASVLIIFMQLSFMDGIAPFFVMLILSIGITIYISIYSYEKIEKPGMNFGRIVVKKLKRDAE
jgi:peptidoglycan/LPS O-acetylase OafA/YrhL